jgi:hypothetical protein
MWAGLSLAVVVFGAAMAAWWLVTIGIGLTGLSVCGWIYEYYVGEHAH